MTSLGASAAATTTCRFSRVRARSRGRISSVFHHELEDPGRSPWREFSYVAPDIRISLDSCRASVEADLRLRLRPSVHAKMVRCRCRACSAARDRSPRLSSFFRACVMYVCVCDAPDAGPVIGATRALTVEAHHCEQLLDLREERPLGDQSHLLIRLRDGGRH